MRQEISVDIAAGTLQFDAFANDEWWNTFTLIIGAVEVGTAVIRSTGPGKLRIFRGFGKEVADQRANHEGRILWNFDGRQKVSIIRLDGQGKAVDLSLFFAEIKRGMDAKMYGFLMESVDVQVLEMLV